ncbi:MAG: hypothetical protein SPE56_11055, partial [Prevotella sp.]|nr:hypothetical protein [Prevotella sp.]
AGFFLVSASSAKTLQSSSFLTLIALISRMLHHVACIKLKFGCADADVSDEIRITDVLSFPPCFFCNGWPNSAITYSPMDLACLYLRFQRKRNQVPPHKKFTLTMMQHPCNLRYQREK